MITLPRSPLGYFLMAFVLLLVAAVPFVAVLWAVGLVAPLWVSLPCALGASVASVLKLVSYKP